MPSVYHKIQDCQSVLVPLNSSIALPKSQATADRKPIKINSGYHINKVPNNAPNPNNPASAIHPSTNANNSDFMFMLTQTPTIDTHPLDVSMVTLCVKDSVAYQIRAGIGEPIRPG
jgi:hypothetical protein